MLVPLMDTAQTEVIPLPSGPARVAWRRSRRARRVSLRIDASTGAVVVTLPMRAARGAGVALLMTHADWVSARLAQLPDATPFLDGATVQVCGRALQITHVPHKRGGAWIEGETLFVTGAPEFLRRRVADFMRAEARRRLILLVADKAARLGAMPRRLTVRDTRSRWGSCASDGSLSFSWRLVMAPEFVQDYVAAHEVAHLRHMNHGNRFWALVRRLTPHTDAAIAWLHAEGARLLRAG